MALESERRPKLSKFEGQIVEARLKEVYTLARIQIKQRKGHSSLHLDIGTYSGFALDTLSSFADHVVSFDLDFNRLTQQAKKQTVAINNPDSISLLNMKAQSIGLADKSVDSVTCIEVFGAGFEGEKKEVASVFQEISRVLKPGGVAVFTVKSETMDRVLSSISGFGSDKGYPVNQRSIYSLLHKSFSTIDWYGQMPLKYEPNSSPPSIGFPVELTQYKGHIYPTINTEIFIPYPVDMKFSENNAQKFIAGNMTWPRYWIGVAQKSREN